jgi:ribosome-associated protein
MTTDSGKKTQLMVSAALEKKATELVLLEMREVTTFTDYFLICSGKSDRQVQAIAQSIADVLEKEGLKPLGLEGAREGRWVLMDYGDVVAHVFLEPVRRFYDLEGLWMDAPRIDFQEGGDLGERKIGSKKKTGQSETG